MQAMMFNSLHRVVDRQAIAVDSRVRLWLNPLVAAGDDGNGAEMLVEQGTRGGQPLESRDIRGKAGWVRFQ
jgi:hypothetical protein